MQKHTTTLNETVEKLSDESSYRQLFHPYREDEALLSGDTVKEIVELCRAVLFPGYFGNARISKQMLRFHMGVNIEALHDLLSGQIYAGLCFVDKKCAGCAESEIRERAESLSEAFIAFLPELRKLLATDVEAAFNNDPAAQNLSEVIFCYPGVRAITNHRIAHQLYKSGVPLIPRMISEMAHSETGIDIHPGAQIAPGEKHR
jgi:serine O-acetyltransferase